MTGMYAKLKKNTKTFVSKKANEDLIRKAEVMVNKASSSFVFSKETIMRLFDGSQTNNLGQPVSANYIMIMLGAHPVASEGYEAGAFTLLTVGCEKVNVRGEEKYYPLTNFNLPANEYSLPVPPEKPPFDIDTYDYPSAKRNAGKPISWNEALSMTGMYAKLKSITKTFINQDEDELLIEKTATMVNKASSSFVFSKETVMRLFDGSEINDLGQPVSANYIMIMLGAHPVASEGYEAGAFTVVTVGCEKMEVNGQAKFYPLTNFNLPANEYSLPVPPEKPPFDIDTYEYATAEMQ
jgi:hypothetical protein